MNKWFDTNLATYAKTALLQAQKRIDQVLDIKEDEIRLQLQQRQLPATTSVLTATVNHSTDNIANQISDISQELTRNDNNVSHGTQENNKNEDFFENFLGNKLNTILSTSSSIIQESDDLNSIKYDNDDQLPNNQILSINHQSPIDLSLTSNTQSINSSSSNTTETTTQLKLNKNEEIFNSSEQIDCDLVDNDENLNQNEDKHKKKLINEQKQIWIQNYLDDNEKKFNEQNDSAEKAEINDEKKIEIDFVKVDNSLSGNASSHSDEQETCVSSDIEVLSLPSYHSSSKRRIDEANNSNKQSNTLNTNANIMLIKSPPPPIQQQTIIDKREPNDDLKVILEQREIQILKLNKQNVELQEKNDNLKSEIEHLTIEINQRNSNLSINYDDITRKYAQVQLDKENLRKLNEQLNADNKELMRQFNEKQEQIEQLINEGHKLSKQELSQSNTIKKLRAKDKENEEIIQNLKNDLKKSEKEVDDLRKILDSKEEADRVNHENLRKLEKTTLNYETELETTKKSLEEAEEKLGSLKNALEKSYKELTELRKMNALKDSKIYEHTTIVETQIKEEIQQAVEKERLIQIKKQDTLKFELQSLRADLQRIEQQYNLRENVLRKEITDLQQQLRGSEERNNELSQSISSATKPLLRQIENLQMSHSSQIQLLENAEKSLIERLKDVQTQLCEITEKERNATEKLLDFTQKCKTYEAQIHTLKLDRSKLNAECDSLRVKLEIYENDKLQKNAQNDVQITLLTKQIETVIKEKKQLESQLEIEKNKTENDVKKLQALINEYEREKEEKSRIALSKRNLNSETSSNDGGDRQLLNSYVLPNNIKQQSQNIVPVYDFLRNSGAINILENLQSKLKEKDGEISQLQKDIFDLERIRESLAKELVNLSTKIEALEEKLNLYPQMDEKLNKLNSEYSALLQMYGEKEEECEELKLDLQDVKEMYRLQIEDLVKRSSLND